MRPITRRATTLLAAGMLTGLVATAAIAADSVTQTVNEGSLTASLTDQDLTAFEYSHAETVNPGTLALTVDDSTGTGDGWNVTVLSSDFVYDGTNGGTDIPAANFAVTTVNAPTHIAGQAIDGTDGPHELAGTGSLDQARAVIEASATFGQGTYGQDLDVALTVPGQSRAGLYTGTMTTTATSGPTTP